MSRRRLYPPYGWPTSQRHERHQAAEESSWTTSEINSKRCQIGESTGESTERVRSLQRTGLALGRGGLNFGTAENNCKTKPARARLWHSTVGHALGAREHPDARRMRRGTCPGRKAVSRSSRERWKSGRKSCFGGDKPSKRALDSPAIGGGEESSPSQIPCLLLGGFAHFNALFSV